MDSVCQALIRCSDVHLFDELTRALDLGHQLDVISRIKAAVVKVTQSASSHCMTSTSPRNTPIILF
jgi:ABC-type cobalamin/Fe3+-siderophores transport system ATPase subunit